MYIIACLGNPGKKYFKSRHNVGFMAGEYLADKYHCSPVKKEFKSLSNRITLKGTECLLLFPQTYMNNSGQAVQEACTFYKVKAEKLIVLHDEIDIPFGDIRIKTGGGHRGHNGLRSIMQHLDSPDFHRIRIGVGRPPHPDMEVADFVLSSFLPEELVKVQEFMPDMEEKVLSLIV